MTARELVQEMLNNVTEHYNRQDKDKATHYAFYEKGFIEGQMEALENLIQSMDRLEIE